MILAFPKLLYAYRNVLIRSIGSDIKQRFAGSFLGMGWFVLTPLIFVSFYSVIYVFVYQIRGPGMSVELYVLNIIAGLLPFLAFSESLNLGTVSLSANKDLLTNTVYPIELLAVRAAVLGHVQLFFGLIILFCFSCYMGVLGVSALLIPVLVVSQILMLIGFSWITSIAFLVIRDVQNLIGFLILMLMVGSPIAYTLDMIPRSLRLLVWLNPFSYFIISYQQIFSGNLHSPIFPLAAVIIGISSIFVGYFFFSKIKLVVSNYV